MFYNLICLIVIDCYVGNGLLKKDDGFFVGGVIVFVMGILVMVWLFKYVLCKFMEVVLFGNLVYNEELKMINFD